jgi:hypothetical protein
MSSRPKQSLSIRLASYLVRNPLIYLYTCILGTLSLLSSFFDRSGRARSVSEVYSVLSSRYAGAANSQATRTAMAAVGDTPTRVTFASAAPATEPIDNAAHLSAFPEVRSVPPVTMAFASNATNNSPPTDPIFRSLFQAGERTQPVSSTVRELWDNPSSLTRTPSVRAPQPLDLFSDRAGTFSS